VLLQSSSHAQRLAPPRACRALVLATLALAVAPAAAVAQGPPGPPGPPPGNGSALPAPPGTALSLVPPGTPAALPGGVTGPGLLSGGGVAFNRTKRSLSIPLACQGNGTVSLTARQAARGTLAKARYRCAGSRGTARLTVSRKVAKRLARRKTVAATATVKQGAKTAKVYFELTVGGPAEAKGFWTDGHLQCSLDGSAVPQAYLAEPDFTASPSVPISTRGWVAWYTAAGGWHWLGVRGENAGRWDTWTATPSGVAQFHPDGAVTPVPWTWGPISVPSGQGIYAVGVYEIVYWVGGRPDYRWLYVNAGTTGAVAAGAGSFYCIYP
jgi:hypothetical protein